MTLNELKYISSLAKEKHFRKASEKCFVSQPTLSIAIKKLEEELEVILFERNKNKIIVTDTGKKIIKLANQILSDVDSIKKISKDKNQYAPLKIGAIYTIGPYLIPKIIPEFHKLFSKIPLIVEESYTNFLSKKLHEGELDVIFISYPFIETNIETFPIYTEKFVVVIPKNHPLEKESQIDFNKIKNETILLLGSDHCFRDQVIKAYPNLLKTNNKNNDWQKTLEGSSLETILYMVASGTGITILPSTAIQNLSNKLLIIKPLKTPIPERIVAMAWRKNFPQTEIMDNLKKILSKITLEYTY